MGEIEIRPLRGIADFRACTALQSEIWGSDFSERVPVAILEVASRLSGVIAGALDESGRLIGFVFGITGLEGGRPVHWSDMLAVAPDYRNLGIGSRLKRYQRSVLLERGISTVYWTFDPLEAKNAYVNFVHLGAVTFEYVRDMYGDTDSPLHRGIGTDRFIAVWRLDSDRVTRRCERSEGPAELSLDSYPVAIEFEEVAGHPRPSAVINGVLDEPTFLVPVPEDVQFLKSSAPELAVAWRHATRELFEDTLDGSREVREIIRGPDGLAFYVVTRKETLA